MVYGFYKVDLILVDEQEKRLQKLEEQFKTINGWNKQQIMQFAAGALPKNIEIMLTFMEGKAYQLLYEL